MPKWTHRTLEVDDIAKRVRCAECGWVPGSPRNGRLRCSTAVRQQRGVRRLTDGRTTVHPEGYVRIAVNGKYRLQHRVVMEQLLGRPLLPEENVHHLNGRRDDNRPENLELWTRSQPPGQRVADKVAWAKEILALYE